MKGEKQGLDSDEAPRKLKEREFGVEGGGVRWLVTVRGPGKI